MRSEITSVTVEVIAAAGGVSVAAEHREQVAGIANAFGPSFESLYAVDLGRGAGTILPGWNPSAGSR